jgi:hypothetical protein
MEACGVISAEKPAGGQASFDFSAAIGSGRELNGNYIASFQGILSSNSHFDPERGCVVPTSRNTSAPKQAISGLHALRLVFNTAALRQNENCCILSDANHLAHACSISSSAPSPRLSGAGR